MSSSWCCPCLSRRPKKAVVESAPATAEKKVVENDVAEKDTSQRLAAFAPEHDREHHVVQWNRAIRRHFGRLKKPQTQQLLLDLCDNTDLESSLAYLQKEYEDHGVVAAFGNLEGSFGAINSFSTALSSIAQAGNQPGQVLWGSFLLLINSTLRHQDILSKITQMLDQLTKAMPRFQAYLDILPTVQLRRALRDIYDDFIEFCLSTADFLSRNPVENFLRLAWNSTEKEFDKMKQQIEAHVQNFESEARLAETEANRKWQEDVMDKLSERTAVSRSTSTLVQPVATLPFPRNLIFTGREEVFEDIGKILQPSGADDQEEMRSIALYGVGGVGKTQTALEYAYRCKANYSHIFWIKSETEVELRQSLFAMVKALSMDQGEDSEHKAMELALKWLNATPDRWLLIFDNVQQRSAIKPYWPQNSAGNVIVTSQKALFEGLTTSQLRINPFTLEEGSSLILKHMHLQEESRKQAEDLSNELSGCPIAIAHYAGYALASHMPLPDLLKTFQRRGMTAEIWSNTSNASLMLYERTLATVWDTALDGLRPDSRELLNIFAFLNPDRITEDFLKSAPGLLPRRESHTAEFSLTLQTTDLLRRNLIERNIATTSSTSLRMHRALRLALLLKLDNAPDERQRVFRKAYELVRASFPHRDMTSRNPEFDPIWRENIPQVLSLQSAFERSDPPIAYDEEFAALLADAGSFLWEQQMNNPARSVLELGEKIALEVQEDGVPSPTLASIENYLALLDAHGSVDRKKAVERLQLVVKLRETFLGSLPSGTATIEQQVDVGRAWNDLAYFYADSEEFEEADQWMTKALNLYKSLGDENTLRFRFSLQYIDITVVRFGQGRIDDALDLAARACSLCRSELGPKHLENVRFESQWGYVLIGAGRFEEALKKFNDVLTVRSEILEKDNPDVLNTHYWIGTIHYYLGQHDEAEKYLRTVIKYGTESGFGKPDLARAQYRLSLVLYAQKRRKEAIAIEEDVIASVTSEDCPQGEDRDEWMQFLDKSVYIQNGRSTGPFRGVRTGYV